MNKHILTHTVLVGLFFGLSHSMAEHPSAKPEHPSKHAEVALEKAEVLAIAFHSDHCGSCKVLAPKMGKVSKSLSDYPILLKRMDLTDEATTAKAKKLASQLGIAELLEANGGKTGYILLLDADSKRQLGKIESAMSVQQIDAQFKSALARAQKDVHSNKKAKKQTRSEHPSKSKPKPEHPSKSEHPR